MPTRALRRAQREKDKEALLSSLKPDDEYPSDEEEESGEGSQPQKQNLFAMLNAGDDDDDGDDGAAEKEDHEEQEAEEEEEVKATPSKKRPNRKKKKKKAKAAAASVPEEAEDEIDAALKALDLSKSASEDTTPRPTKEQISAASKLASLLKVDSKNLDPDNEMRRLFGRAALNAEDDDAPQHPGGRNARRTAGRALPAGKRNVFVQPGEGWPPASSGGLGMEVVKSNDDGSVEYKYVHSKAYKDVQRQFLECVVSMDPQRMIMHLQTSPYHISTLLQVSTIALTHNNPPDYTSSQTLISRALYSLGRSSHSTYPTSLSSGAARLSYKHFENRELWYAGWKYIESLSRRGMWRTGLEMVKVLLQMDPAGDPLCLALCIDQYTLKSRQAQFLLDLYESEVLNPVWSTLPNIVYSVPLALLQLGRQEECRVKLKEAVVKYPWMVSTLYSSLNMDVPTELWGVLPPMDEDKLLAEMYAHRCADTWNIPENTSLLFEVAGRVKKSELSAENSAINYFTSKSRDVYRHVILMEVRNLLSYLPNAIKANTGMAWDPLPPLDGISDYEREMASEPSSRLLRAALSGPSVEGGEGGTGALGLIQSFVASLMPWAGPMPDVRDAQGNVDHVEVQNWMRDALREAAGRGDEAWMGNMLQLNGEEGEALRRAFREHEEEDREGEGNGQGEERR